MLIGIVKENLPGENRVAMVPSVARKLVQKGAAVAVEASLGETISLCDDDYTKAGAEVLGRDDILARADILLRVRKTPPEEIPQLKKDVYHISFLDPFSEKDLVHQLAAQHVRTISMEMIPRSTFAQKMDALSSQANLAGYVTVIQAAARIKKAFPMMMTPSGTISPARVFVIGAGVAGLQAIATAKRLGARVEAFDTRPVVEEQVQSLGAKFVKIDLGETGQTKDGYAKQLTEEQLEKQRQAMAKVCAQSHVVITTAQLFGRKAPVIITHDMIAAMKPGSVIVDMAVESGGNVEGSRINEEVDIGGVAVIGQGNLPGFVAQDASLMYASNMYHLLDTFWNGESRQFEPDFEHEILKSALITRDGEVVNEKIKANG